MVKPIQRSQASPELKKNRVRLRDSWQLDTVDRFKTTKNTVSYFYLMFMGCVHR